MLLCGILCTVSFYIGLHNPSCVTETRNCILFPVHRYLHISNHHQHPLLPCKHEKNWKVYANVALTLRQLRAHLSSNFLPLNRRIPYPSWPVIGSCGLFLYMSTPLSPSKDGSSSLSTWQDLESPWAFDEGVSRLTEVTRPTMQQARVLNWIKRKKQHCLLYLLTVVTWWPVASRSCLRVSRQVSLIKPKLKINSPFLMLLLWGILS